MRATRWQRIGYSTTGTRYYVRLIETNPRARTGYGWQTGRRPAPGHPVYETNGGRLFATRDLAVRASIP